MDNEHSIENTKKYAIMEVMFFNGYTVGMQSFVLLSLAIYFNMSSFFISIVSSLPTAGYLLQIFTKRVNLLLGSRKRTMVIAATVSRLVICVMPFAVFFDIRRQEVYFAVMFIYALVSPFSNNVWTAVMTKIVDKRERGKYFGKRNLFSSLSTVVYTLLYGYVLSMPDRKNAMLVLTTAMSISAIGSAIFMCLHYVPDSESDMKKVSIKTAFKNKNFVVYLKFASVWLFTWEFLKPMTEYYRIKVLGVNTMFISQMGVLTAILSSILYLVYGKLSDKYGNKTMLRMGIFFTTYYVLTYFSMTQDNKMSMLFVAAVIDAMVSGLSAILAGLFGGILGKFINNGVIYIFGEQFYTIRFAFVIGFILRLFSLLELTRVYSFEKTFVYPGGSSRIKSMFSKIMFSGSRYVIHSNKGKNEDSDEQNVDKEKNVSGKSNESKKEL